MIIKTGFGKIKIQVEIDIPEINQQDENIINLTLTPIIEKFAALLSGIIQSGEFAQLGLDTLKSKLIETAKIILDALTKNKTEKTTLH